MGTQISQSTRVTPPTSEDLTPRRTNQVRSTTNITTADLIEILREEVLIVIERMLKEEIARQMEEKLKGTKVNADQRASIYEKVYQDAEKQVPELLNKVLEEQLSLADEGTFREGEYRVGENMEKEIENEVRVIVQRSLEKAIADEVFQKVKNEKVVEKLLPTFETAYGNDVDFDDDDDDTLGYLGIRHLQAFSVLLVLAISYLQRADISVALVAMTNSNEANPNFQDFEWDESVKGLLLSSFFWGYIFVQLPGGVLVERYGPKLVMSISMFLCSTTALIMPAATLQTGWIGLYILKVLQGITQGAFIPGVYVFVSKWIPPQEKAKLFTPAFGGMQLGTVIGLPVSGFLCASPFGWPAAFFFSAIVGYLWVILWIFTAANSPAVHRSISREEQLYIEGSFGFGEITMKGAKKTVPWKSILSSLPFIAVMVGHFGENWAYLTLMSEMPIFLNVIMDIDIAQVSLLSSSTYFFGWILIVILGFVASLLRRKNLYSVGVERKLWTSIALYGMAICFAILGITRTTNFFSVMSLLTALIVTNSTIYNGVYSNHADLSPNYVGILMGLSNTVGNISSVLAPLFVGISVTNPSDIEQWGYVFRIAAIVCFVCNTFYLLFSSSEIQSWNTPSNLHLQLEKVDSFDGTFGSHRERLLLSGLDDFAENLEHQHQQRRNTV